MNDRALKAALEELACSSIVQSGHLYAVQRAALASSDTTDLDKVTRFVIGHVFGALAQRLESAGDELAGSQYEVVVATTLAVVRGEEAIRVKQLRELIDLLGPGVGQTN